jgi:hypothetical protein
MVASRRPGSRYNSRSHAHVGFLIILALVSLVLALGLYAYGNVKTAEPALQERNCRMEQMLAGVTDPAELERLCSSAAVGSAPPSEQLRGDEAEEQISQPSD